jgi:hypothetical protein
MTHLNTCLCSPWTLLFSAFVLEVTCFLVSQEHNKNADIEISAHDALLEFSAHDASLILIAKM